MTTPNRNIAQDVTMRERVEREARRLRDEAFDRYVVAPVAAWMKRGASMFRVQRPVTIH